MGKFVVKGLAPPGKVNAMVGGRFRDVELYNAPQHILQQLFEGGCPFVTMSDPQTSVRELPVMTVSSKKKTSKK